jgi:hypothetical protein
MDLARVTREAKRASLSMALATVSNSAKASGWWKFFRVRAI